MHDLYLWKYVQLFFEIGYVGLTDFRSPEKIAEEEAEIERETVNQNIVSFVLDKDGYIQEASQNHQEVIGQKKPDYNPDIFKMYWTYDTPGVENPEQVCLCVFST